MLHEELAGLSVGEPVEQPNGDIGGLANHAELSIDPAYAQFRDQSRFWVQRVAVPMIMVIGLFGNLITVIIMTRRRMRSTTNMYLAALAFVDMLYLVLTFILGLSHYPNMAERKYYIYWRLKPFLMMLTDACSNTSVWLTVTFTIERFIAVKYPMKGKVWCTEARAKRLIGAVFAIAIVFALPVPFEWQVIEKEINIESLANSSQADTFKRQHLAVLALDNTEFGRDETYKTVYYRLTAVLFYFLPLISVTLFNWFLIHSVHRSSKERKRMTNQHNSSSQRLQNCSKQLSKNSVQENNKSTNSSYSSSREQSPGKKHIKPNSLARLFSYNNNLSSQHAPLVNACKGASRRGSDVACKSEIQRQMLQELNGNESLAKNCVIFQHKTGGAGGGQNGRAKGELFAKMVQNENRNCDKEVGQVKQTVGSQSALHCQHKANNKETNVNASESPRHKNDVSVSLPNQGSLLSGDCHQRLTVLPGERRSSGTDKEQACYSIKVDNSSGVASSDDTRGSTKHIGCQQPAVVGNGTFHCGTDSGGGSNVTLSASATASASTTGTQQQQQGAPQVVSVASSQERRITIMLIAVVLLFLVCQIPSAAMLLYTSVYETRPNTNEHALLLALGNIFNFLMAINAAGNFILYSFLSKKYRRTFVILFCGCFRSQLGNKQKQPTTRCSQSFFSTTYQAGNQLTLSKQATSSAPHSDNNNNNTSKATQLTPISSDSLKKRSINSNVRFTQYEAKPLQHNDKPEGTLISYSGYDITDGRCDTLV